MVVLINIINLKVKKLLNPRRLEGMLTYNYFLVPFRLIGLAVSPGK